jgi:mono/diheme cytochrome c family protein
VRQNQRTLHDDRRRHRRALLTILLVAPATVTALVAGCSGSEVNISSQSHRDGGGSGDGASAEKDRAIDDGGVSDEAAAQKKLPGSGLLARGEYLVDHVAVCGSCHTPVGANGVADRSKYLAGVECVMNDNGACLNSGNLTKLGGYTDEQIKVMFMEGKRPDGRNLHPMMPYWIFGNMTDKDADSIVAHLRSLPEVDHVVPPNEGAFRDVPMPAERLDPRAIPGTDGGAAAERGRYLSAAVGICIDCHTPDLPAGAERPIDLSKSFTGNRAFQNILVAQSPTTVYSANITPQVVGGIGGWSVADIRKAIREGRDRGGHGICAPMPWGQRGYGGMTEQDANDIATYLLGIPPVNINVTGTCSGP